MNKLTLPFIAAELILLVMGLYLLTTAVPPLIAGGLVLAAAAPFAFMVGQVSQPEPGRRLHPVLTSVLSGFGCVMTMIGVHRFGDQHRWILLAALAALGLWMVWQRYLWRRHGLTKQLPPRNGR